MLTATTPAAYRTFDGFGRWYASRRLRETGRMASAHTLRTKQVHLAGIARRNGNLDEEFLATLLVSRNSVSALMEELSVRMTPGAMRQAVYALRDFGDYAVSRGWIQEHMVLRTDVPSRNPERPITVYSREEMEQFVALARGRGLRWWALLAFCADTGRRIGEALSLEWTWFRLDEPVPYVELPHSKNGNPQYIPLPRRTREDVFTPANIATLRAERREGHRAWGRSPERHPFPWAYSTVNSRFEHFCQVTGLPNRGFHNFRHTVITSRLASGMPLQAVSKLAGHANTGITDGRYNHTDALTYSKYLD